MIVTGNSLSVNHNMISLTNWEGVSRIDDGTVV